MMKNSIHVMTKVIAGVLFLLKWNLIFYFKLLEIEACGPLRMILRSLYEIELNSLCGIVPYMVVVKSDKVI